MFLFPFLFSFPFLFFFSFFFYLLNPETCSLFYFSLYFLIAYTVEFLRCFFFSFLFLVVPSYSLFLFISHVVALSLPGAQRTTSDCFELLERSCCVVGVSFSSRCESFLWIIKRETPGTGGCPWWEAREPRSWTPSRSDLWDHRRWTAGRGTEIDKNVHLTIISCWLVHVFIMSYYQVLDYRFLYLIFMHNCEFRKFAC